ncbi:MAG: CPBP family glutamic-type intramembrane protease [Candidatus Hydrogenedentales bacterium]
MTRTARMVRFPLSPTFAAIYVALALITCVLIDQSVRWPFRWNSLIWQPFPSPFNGFEMNKALPWLLIPFVLCLPTMDWGYLGFRRWKRADLCLLLALAGVCLLAVLLVPFIPSLKAWYPGIAEQPFDLRWRVVIFQLAWIASWLPGWEFLHRYFLLRPFQERFKRFGWLVVPLSEGLFHLQKHPLEMVGMVAISLVLTFWAARRRNMMLPFLAHLIVEVELVIVRLFY